MNYKLAAKSKQKSSMVGALRKLVPLLRNERFLLLGAVIAMIISTLGSLLSPLVIAHIVDTAILTKQYLLVLQWSGILLIIYLVSSLTTYLQIKMMGGVGQRLLFTLRKEIFVKLQELPLEFFNQNKAGDLISRINNDTDKLNQFFSQSLMQFVSNLFLMIGAAFFLFFLQRELGTAALAPAIGLLIFTQAISGWIKRKNATSLRAVGDMSAEIQESLDNFKLIVAFNRRDYFRNRFQEVNELNYQTAVSAGVANNTLTPVYGLVSNIAQLIVLFFGIALIKEGQVTIGLLVGYITYVNRFYEPIRQIASIWPNFQIALAGWDRVSEILDIKSELTVLPTSSKEPTSRHLLEFDEVSFAYTPENEVLHDISFSLEPGKTYAFVGPTGGGKTTTASLMARLFDPTHGTVRLNGKDIRTFSHAERTQKIGFILQEPIMFTGTVRDNILYGNTEFSHMSTKELEHELKKAGLQDLLQRFPQGLETKVTSKGETISLGQQQLIAFIRAVLRKPELLILDEATANVDTVTEKLLGEILEKLDPSTTRVVIAHRFNTIENADEIFFVNGGTVQKAGSLKHAMELLLHEKRGS